MKVIYDKETDTLSIILRKGKVAESDETRPGLILDYDKSGRLVSIEMGVTASPQRCKIRCNEELYQVSA